MDRIRLGSLTKWHRIASGEAVHFPGKKTRTVIVEVNSPGVATYWVTLHDKDQRTLKAQEAEEAQRTREEVDYSDYLVGTVRGRGSIEFSVTGSFDLYPDGCDEAYIYSHDNLKMVNHVVAPLVYTRIANRRMRNPEQERIEWELKQNQRRFLEELSLEQERRLADMERRYYDQSKDESRKGVSQYGGPPRAVLGTPGEVSEVGGRTIDQGEGGARSGLPDDGQAVGEAALGKPAKKKAD